jgi:hypothetical protein
MRSVRVKEDALAGNIGLPKSNQPPAKGRENRKHPRIGINVQVSCVSVDKDGLPLDRNTGCLKDVSQGGLAIEADGNALSDRLAIVFTDADNQTVGMVGRVAHSKKCANGKYSIGVAFLAEPKENLDFVAKAVRHYHYYKNAIVG